MCCIILNFVGDDELVLHLVFLSGCIALLGKKRAENMLVTGEISVENSVLSFMAECQERLGSLVAYLLLLCTQLSF